MSGDTVTQSEGKNHPGRSWFLHNTVLGNDDVNALNRHIKRASPSKFAVASRRFTSMSTKYLHLMWQSGPEIDATHSSLRKRPNGPRAAKGPHSRCRTTITVGNTRKTSYLRDMAEKPVTNDTISEYLCDAQPGASGAGTCRAVRPSGYIRSEGGRRIAVHLASLQCAPPRSATGPPSQHRSDTSTSHSFLVKKSRGKSEDVDTEAFQICAP